MKVSCPSCDAKYTIADDKVVGKKIKVRCKTCGTQILVDGTVALPQSDQPSSGSESVSASDSNAQPESLPPVDPSMESNESDAWTVNLSETEERTMTTNEIVEASLKNEIGNDVFVWKDGMNDWVLVDDVPELRDAIAAARKKTTDEAGKTPGGSKVALNAGASSTAATGNAGDDKNAAPAPAAEAADKRGPIVAAPGSALAKKMASAKAASLAPKPESASDKPKEAKESKSLPEKKAATRMAAKRPGSTHDLFAAVDQAGSEIDVDTSAPEEPEHKATGARNENSVLFSLDALKSGIGTTSKGAPPATGSASKKAPPPPTKRLEDLMTIDAPAPIGAIGGGGLLLSGNDALLTAPAPPPPKPEPKPAPVVAAVPGVASLPAKPKNKAAMIALIVASIGLVGTAGAFIALKLAAPETPAAASASVSSGAPLAAAPSASAAAVPSAPPAASAAVAAASSEPEAPAASASAPAPKTPVASEHKPGGGVTKPTEPKEPTKPEKKPEPTPAAAGGFSKDAAVAALSVAAAQATVCKKPEGPWGTGKCLVTFAPSGRVTSANVTGAPFGGTPVGGCVSSVFRRAKIPAFNGDPVTVSKSFTISP